VIELCDPAPEATEEGRRMQKAVRWLVVDGIARLAEGACDQTA
jgi:hypothetical protein